MNTICIAVVPLGCTNATCIAKISIDLFKFMSEGTRRLACGLRQIRQITPVEYETMLAFEALPVSTEIVDKMIEFRLKNDRVFAFDITTDSNEGDGWRTERLSTLADDIFERTDDGSVLEKIGSLYDHKGNLTVEWNELPTILAVKIISEEWSHEDGGEPCQTRHHMLGDDTDAAPGYMLIHQGCFNCGCYNPHISDPETWHIPGPLE